VANIAGSGKDLRGTLACLEILHLRQRSLRRKTAHQKHHRRQTERSAHHSKPPETDIMSRAARATFAIVVPRVVIAVVKKSH
jgi:hypothetical protein